MEFEKAEEDISFDKRGRYGSTCGILVVYYYLRQEEVLAIRVVARVRRQSTTARTGGV